MQTNRISPRYNAMGRARVLDVLKNDFSLKNISITGCCLEYIEDKPLASSAAHCSGKIKPHEIYLIEIIPERAAHIGKFELQAECRWIRSKDNSDEIGFRVTVSPKGKFFQNYVDYIDYYSTTA